MSSSAINIPGTLNSLSTKVGELLVAEGAEGANPTTGNGKAWRLIDTAVDRYHNRID